LVKGTLPKKLKYTYISYFSIDNVRVIYTKEV